MNLIIAITIQDTMITTTITAVTTTDIMIITAMMNMTMNLMTHIR